MERARAISCGVVPHRRFFGLKLSSSSAWWQYTFPLVLTATMWVDSVKTCGGLFHQFRVFALLVLGHGRCCAVDGGDGVVAIATTVPCLVQNRAVVLPVIVPAGED